MLVKIAPPPASPAPALPRPPSRLQPGGRVRCWRVCARPWSRRSHSSTGIWHWSSCSAPSRPSARPAALTCGQRGEVEGHRGVCCSEVIVYICCVVIKIIAWDQCIPFNIYLLLCLFCGASLTNSTHYNLLIETQIN